MVEDFVASRGCRIFAKVLQGHASAPWLVFSNSLMTDHSIWGSQVSYFAQRYNILTYDQRGHGRSDVSAVVTFEDLSSDVIALLDHFRIQECTYIGLSMGVPTGLSLVSLHPERVSRLVLVDGQMATQPSGRQTWQARIDAAQANGMPWVAKDTVGRWFAASFIECGGADRLERAAAEMTVEGYCACAGALQDYNFSEVAKNLAIPVQLLAGANDGAMPQTMSVMADTMANARIDLIAEAGHIPNVEQADAFNAALDRFLNSHKT